LEFGFKTNPMKLFKKIAYKRAKELSQFEEVFKRFNEMKSAGSTNGVSREELLSNLAFYIIIEYSNVVDRINYSRIFCQNGTVNYDALVSEQKKLCEHIIRKNCGYPEVFKLLGPVNEVLGCYLIATRKKSVKCLTTKNTPNTISVRISNKELPKEAELMCSEYNRAKIASLSKERSDFENFIRLRFEQQDAILQSVLFNVQLYPVVISESLMWSESVNKQEKANTMYNKNRPIRIEDIASKNIDNITSVEFLNTLLDLSVKSENYELCARIRDRISLLSSRTVLVPKKA
jgi:hypothetical protein